MPSDPKSVPEVSATLDRRRFLKYVGAGTGAIFGAGLGGSLLQIGCASPETASAGWVLPDGTGNWRPPAYPLPLPGSDADHPDSKVFAAYEVIDDLVLPDSFRYDVMAEWSQIFGSDGHEVRFGYGNDYTGLLPIDGSTDQFWLFVNHEYVAARPWLEAFSEVFGEAPPDLRVARDSRVPVVSERGVCSFDGYVFPQGDRLDVTDAPALAQIPPAVLQEMRGLAQMHLQEMGVSVLRVRRLAEGRFEVVGSADDHRRITAIDRQNIPGEPIEHSRFSGPSAWLFDSPPRGTMSNCSGGTTPWGTFLTCEENFHNDAEDDISPSGREIEGKRRFYQSETLKVGKSYVFDNEMPFMITGNGHLLDRPLDGREYGWVCEVEPETGHMTKHTALGRFRHENVALRVDVGRPLAAYMGDDRRGGHIWKFVSEGTVDDPRDPANSSLLEKGTLYVAQFREDFTGSWIPLVRDTPLWRPEPEHHFSQHIQLPARPEGGAVKVGDTQHKRPEIEVDDWVETIEAFTGKSFAESTLGDLVSVDREAADPDSILLMDAFLMANAAGGTPSARPEDLEVHPQDRTVYIAFTDATESSDGAPDQRIFPDSAMDTSRQYGAIYRIIEGDDESSSSDPGSKTFTWGKFVSSGEVAEQGGGFACADNMVFDPNHNLWMVTDISTSTQNFPTSRKKADGSNPGGKTFPGVFGNNAMFMLPTTGEKAGLPQLFATAPMDAELCGPTFTDDGETLILSVQHPGEVNGARRAGAAVQQTHVIHDRDNQPFDQKRIVPEGSNFPHGEDGRAPRPCVVCITKT